ncbi:hypothetical protein AWH56_019900 [Anaerobacillus isosaccharinicus]|uniref:Uncharacterized protein n=1 Tax=Anaerobacillus isosaccharinicus TaxID=1532552 RepID=A0A1S2KX63_9BACI|nr:hypothetical protein [Anaerobacillus isosaccharinicus]MBA5586831.1 hypothetical protein [Anaerobacillus isosaccharinicus]QOY34956.1 hypothetical protein AWH56_019900 [Anaerobacillus isosaccharinicus]
MKFTVKYIPLSKIKPDPSLKISGHVKKLQRFMSDCMYILVVKKSKDGSYSILNGQDHFDHLKKSPKNIYAPCIVDESTSSGLKSWFSKVRNKQNLDDFPMTPKSWSIVRSFLKQEPRFQNLSRMEQLKILVLALRYKRTVISAMKTKVDQMIKK